jgi:hypothetical protein
MQAVQVPHYFLSFFQQGNASNFLVTFKGIGIFFIRETMNEAGCRFLQGVYNFSHCSVPKYMGFDRNRPFDQTEVDFSVWMHYFLIES